MSKSHDRIVGIISLLGLLAFADLASGQRERDLGRTDTRGLIKTVDLDKATITIEIISGRGTPAAEKTFAIAKNAELCVASSRGPGVFKEVKLADLGAGIMVGLGLSADQKIVESLVAEEPVIRGLFKKYDATKNTLVLGMQSGREPAAEEATFVLSSDVEIVVDDGRGRRSSLREGKIDDLKEGAFISARLSLDKSQVRMIVAEGTSVSGTIKAIDPEKRSVTLTLRPTRGNEEGEEQSITIAKEAFVLIDDGKGRRLSLKEGKLSDLPVGSSATVRMSVDLSHGTFIRAEGPSVFGLLKGVDADKQTITIAIPKGRNPEEKTLALAKDARVTVDGVDAKLGDLKVAENGPFIQLRLSLDQKSVQVVAARQPRER